MKSIEPINIWQNGQTKQATVLNAYVIQDNLSTSATFYYSLLDSGLNQLANGNLVMTGDDYTAYETNLQAWDWVIAKLGLTLIGDWTTTTTSTTTTTTEVPTNPSLSSDSTTTTTTK